MMADDLDALLVETRAAAARGLEAFGQRITAEPPRLRRRERRRLERALRQLARLAGGAR